MVEISAKFPIASLLIYNVGDMGKAKIVYHVEYRPAHGHMDIKYSMGPSSAFETSNATVRVLSHDHRSKALRNKIRRKLK